MYEVSIIIPVFNVGNYIEASFRSAINQTFESIEFIVVNDCSSDDSISRIKQLISNHRRKNDVKIITHDINRGLGAARNTGLQNATGKFIFFMDSDDEITSDCIDIHHRAIKGGNIDFTIGNFKLIGGKSTHIKDIDAANWRPPNILKSFFSFKWTVSACNKLYKREFINTKNILFQEALLHEDILWSYKIAKAANLVVSIKEKTYIYILRKNSITTSISSIKKIEDLLYIIKLINFSKIENTTYVKYGDNFLNRWKLNTALLLLNSNINRKEKIKLYDEIRQIKTSSNLLYLLIFSLSFDCFNLCFKLPYFIYKK